MKIVSLVARLVLGLAFIIFGLNGFLLFMSPPPMSSIPPNAAAFSSAMMVSHYTYLTSGTQVLGGVLLLANQYVVLALVMLAAVIVNILTFHLTMWTQGLPLAIAVAILWFLAAWPVRSRLAQIFTR